MSNKTQLQANNTQLAALIETLQGKAAGGGGASVETCTVRLYNTDGCICLWGYSYETLNADGTVDHQYGYFNNSAIIKRETFDIIIENVVCGSVFTIFGCSSYDSLISESLNECVSIGKVSGVGYDTHIVVHITAEAGNTATICLYDDD